MATGASAIANKLVGNKGKKATVKKSAAKKTSAKKSTGPRKSTRVQIKDAKGKIVTGRDESFVCNVCKESITGPWSFKQHLIKQHDWSPEKAGLNPQKKGKK